ncbi:DUF262 domain-containing protein [Agrobacterium cavarae]|uniref:DUF262 domain-containing protein n=1 Tax=Agrobacterium cavarae TaxID=2528239 RepID=A0ABY1YD65_9HYPH|nr:DUF262 domain-containing protein [Agrobacterium cavarae]TBN17113.1 DUF262 domain-containing protein [Agrobacterium cavarae]
MKIQPHALSISNLLGTQNEQFLIPSYQRRYSWRPEQLYQLIDDLGMIETNEGHLLGSIVCLTGAHSGGLNTLELVDGQQRLTTISILLECLRERFEAEGNIDRVQEISRLLMCKTYDGPAMPKIKLDTMDAGEFKAHLEKPSGQGQSFLNDNLRKVFESAREWVSGQAPEDISKFTYKLISDAIIVRLDVSNAKDAFKLFETINNRGLKLSLTDIIKNFMLGNAARFGNDQLEAAKKSWSTLMSHLDGTDTDSFFRYFLISKLQARVTKSKVIEDFRWFFMSEVVEADILPDRGFYYWEEENEEDESGDADEAEVKLEAHANATTQITFKEFLENLVIAGKAFGELISGETGHKKIDRHLRNLRMIKATQAYGFLMHLRVGRIDDATFIKVLKLTENFLVRRHVCRERANETETLFAHLCEIDPQNPLQDLIESYRDYTPSDDKFQEDFASAQYPANIIERARYCLEQFEIAKHGTHQELAVLGSDEVHVEHIIPQKIQARRNRPEQEGWLAYLGDKAVHRHTRNVGRIGNLTLFAGTLNIMASNNPFEAQKSSYQKSSILLTKALGKQAHFRFAQVEARSKELAAVAVTQWPIP